VSDLSSEPTLGGDPVVGAAHDLVSRFHPEELPLFEGTAQAYLSHPARVGGRSRDMEPLGLGAELSSITPAALWAGHEAMRLVLTSSAHMAEEEGSGLIRRALRRALVRFRRDRRAPKAAAYTPDQLRAVRRAALANAKKTGMAGREAEFLADAIVGGLAVSE
jgi:hypothetical protein